IGAAYGVPVHRQQLITSMYNISSGCMILLWARIADVYGREKIFIVGSALYTLTSIGLPFLSPNETALYVFRALQGVSVAASMPASMGILAARFPAGKARNYAFVVYNSTASLGAVMGNITSGIIGGCFSWEWVFWGAAVMGGLVTLLAALRPTVDWLGGILVTASLVTFLVALSDNNGGWTSFWKPIQLAAALILGLGFVSWQRQIKDDVDRPPLIKLSLFGNKRLTASLVTYACFVASFNTFLVYASLFFQQYLGLSVLETTWRFIPSGVSCCLISFVIAPALSTIPGFYLLILAILANMVSPLLFALPIPPSTSYWTYSFPAMCLTMSIEVLAAVIALYVMHCLPQGDQALGGGLLQTANNLGKAVGLAVAGLVQGAVERGANHHIEGTRLDGRVGDERLLVGLRAAQGLNVGLAIVALVVVVGFLKESKNL
ncbi:drug resistance protein, partial [Periconia macrospinosa]